MTNQTPDKILSRAAKLMVLANDAGATEAEAALAATRLQELLQDYNLTTSQVEAAANSNNAAPTVARAKSTTDFRAMYDYQRELMTTLATNNFCMARVVEVFTPSSWGRRTRRIDGVVVGGHVEKRHMLVGREINVKVTIQTYEYLIKAMDRAAINAGLSLRYRNREINYFLSGAVARLCERLNEARREAEALSDQPKSTTGRDLVLSDVYGTEADLNNDALNGFPAGTTAAKRREREAARAKQEAEHDRLVAEGVDSTVAWYRAYGYDPDRAASLAKSWNRGRGGRSRRGTGWADPHYKKINSATYKAGRTAGDAIGLNAQISSTSRKALPGISK